MFLLLTEAGYGIGFGHVTRLIAIGEALQGMGVNLRMLVQWEGVHSEIILEGRPWIFVSSWRLNSLARLKQYDARAALIDSYRLGLQEYGEVIKSGIKLAVMDDFYRLPYPADLIINPNSFGESSNYQKHAKHAIAGIDYVILRKPVLDAACSFFLRPQCHRVLLTLGGSDVHQIGPRLAAALAERGWVVNWIAPEQSRDEPMQQPHLTIHGTQTADGIVNLVKDADIVVCGGGQTLHELACIGAPCVAIELGDDQQLNLDFYEHKSYLGPRLHWSSATLIKDTIQRIESISSKVERSRLSNLGCSLVDGLGTQRIAPRLADLLN